MEQLGFGIDLSTDKTRNPAFLEEMEHVVRGVRAITMAVVATSLIATFGADSHPTEALQTDEVPL